jgi:hypothetical protein
VSASPKYCQPTPRDHSGADAVVAYFSFDESGRVECRTFSPNDPPEPKPLDILLWRAKRQWRRWFP